MAVELYIPKMSDHMEEATFTEWLVSEGDRVEEGQPVLSIETDKVEAEVEAPASGFLSGIRSGLVEGVVIPVGETVAFIVDDLEEEVPTLEPLTASPEHAGAQKSEAAGSNALSEVAEPPPMAAPPAASASTASAGGPVRATPAARKAGRELGIDLATVVGTGAGARISESDVRQQVSPGVGSDVEDTRPRATLKLTPAQRVTARRMTESVVVAPQFSLVRHIDMTAALGSRNAADDDPGSKPSVTALLVEAIAAALVKHPRVNGFFRDNEVELNDDINVGVAVGTEDGLFVPVIRNADRLSVTEIADRLNRFRGLADNRGFAADDFEGGTITLSNLGMLGVDEFRAIVNPPQGAILATGRVCKSVVVDGDGAIGTYDRMTMTMTADHRSLDGLGAARFLSSVAARLEPSDPRVGEGS